MDQLRGRAGEMGWWSACSGETLKHHRQSASRSLQSGDHLTLRSGVRPGTEKFVRDDLVLGRHQLVDGRLVLEEDLHPDERFPALLSEHVPGLRSRQQVRHGALGETQHGLTEQSLADAVLAE